MKRLAASVVFAAVVLMPAVSVAKSTQADDQSDPVR